jgi:type IV pilus assembly protein PilA
VHDTAKGYTLVELMVTVAIIGILAAISIPNFRRLQASSQQSEVRSNLRALYDFEQAHLMEYSRYTKSVVRLGFAPERGNRYQYGLKGSPITSDDRTGTTATTGLTADAIMVDVFRYGAAAAAAIPTQSPCSTPFVTAGRAGAAFTAVAQGNIDDDATIDLWSISSTSRDMSNCADVAGNVAAGEPANDVNDVND